MSLSSQLAMVCIGTVVLVQDTDVCCVRGALQLVMHLMAIASLPALTKTVLHMATHSGLQPAEQNQQQPSPEPEEVLAPTVAYAVTITRIDEGDAGQTLLDAIEVLGLSIDSVCRRSKYDCAKVAFVDPSVRAERRGPLSALGWRVLERGVPLDIAQIEGEKLRNRIDKSGCCGASELIKLWAFSLTEYYRVLHLDVDALMLQPVDELIARDVELVYTTDVKMAPNAHNMPVQGGFLLCRPSQATFDELVGIVKKGDWAPNVGWARSGIGFFHGGPTIQGLLAYYYRHDRTLPNRALPPPLLLSPPPPPLQGLLAYYYRFLKPTELSYEADRCAFNHMWDTPECRSYAIGDVHSVHFTQSCPKPWVCTARRQAGCDALSARWYALRAAARARARASRPPTRASTAATCPSPPLEVQVDAILQQAAGVFAAASAVVVPTTRERRRRPRRQPMRGSPSRGPNVEAVGAAAIGHDGGLFCAP
ncbi:hypothetical protein JKP88DRAFT_304203 [Tribonema minus]|uniref:Uncharacterized protein n=1 Tax=Tribonema minus TaxID=303371 RepID=A0A835Z761_9STRA|nr:hypothetical protein JKP88DRAFT_304203 [Tribonema minus]